MATPKKTPVTKAIPSQKLDCTWEGAQKELAGAVSAEQGADKKWSRVSDILWILGVRPSALEQVPDSKGKMSDSDTYLKVRGMVIKAFGPKVETLLGTKGAALSGLTEVERHTRRYYDKRTGVMMSRVVAYLKRHEENERGVVAKATLAESIVKVLRTQISRIKKADEKRIDFDVDAVTEALNTAIAELT